MGKSSRVAEGKLQKLSRRGFLKAAAALGGTAAVAGFPHIATAAGKTTTWRIQTSRRRARYLQEMVQQRH